MPIFAALGALMLIFFALWDAFETVILPRRVTRAFRLTRMYFASTWKFWSMMARKMHSHSRQEGFLSIFGPLALILLLVLWATLLIVGYALLQWALGSQMVSSRGTVGWGTDLYMSGTTFFTLGLGDVIPRTPLARVLTVVEAGTGLGLLAIVIGYLPVLYQAFSQREVNISLLDARAGSPPSAVELLRRHSQGSDIAMLIQLLYEWERWAAELLESHLSYPILAYFRSQHESQSWLAALTMILDVCTLIMVGIEIDSNVTIPSKQAQLTFAMARHAAADLSQILRTVPHAPHSDRLLQSDVMQLRKVLTATGVRLAEGDVANHKLTTLRQSYEPFVHTLGDRLLIPLPSWLPDLSTTDDWQTTPWERFTALPPL